MSEILPCPFCGSKGSLRFEYDPETDGQFVAVQCHGCRAQSGQKYHGKGNDCPQFYEEVRAEWNRRSVHAQGDKS